MDLEGEEMYLTFGETMYDTPRHGSTAKSTREECEEKLKVLIAEMKAELAELKRQKSDRH